MVSAHDLLKKNQVYENQFTTEVTDYTIVKFKQKTEVTEKNVEFNMNLKVQLLCLCPVIFRPKTELFSVFMRLHCDSKEDGISLIESIVNIFLLIKKQNKTKSPMVLLCRPGASDI